MQNKYIPIVISLCVILLNGCDSETTTDSPLPAAGHARFFLNGSPIVTPEISIAVDTNSPTYTMTNIQIATDDHILSMGFYTDDTTDRNAILFAYAILDTPNGTKYIVSATEDKHYRVVHDDISRRELSAEFEFPNMILRGGAFSSIPYDFEPARWSNVSMTFLNKPAFLYVEPYQEVYAQQNKRSGVWRVSFQLHSHTQLDLMFRPDQQVEGRYILEDTSSLHCATARYTQYGASSEKHWKFATTSVSNSFLEVTGFDPIHRRIKGTFYVQMPSVNSQDTLTVEGSFEKCKVNYTFKD